MEEKTLFALRAPEIGQAADETQTVVSNGGELLIKIRSRKQKIVNGKVVETTTPSCKVTMGESWLSSRVEVDNQYNILDVYFDIEKNTSSSERISVITVTQNESGKELIIHIIQKSGVTYTGYIKMITNSLPLGGNKNNTAQILVMAYLNGSDGSKKPETPTVGSAPDWCAVSVASMDILPENHYMVSLTALSSNQTGANRSGHIFLTCGDANLSILVSQLPKPLKQFTLTGLPLNKPCYLFASGSRPQRGSGPTSGYLGLENPGLGGSVTMNIPVTVNLSSYGDTTKADTGDIVTVWTSSGRSFSQIGSFTVPSAGGTVSI